MLNTEGFMQDLKGLFDRIKQHDKIAVRVSSDKHNDLPPDVVEKLIKPHKSDTYFFIFIYKGSYRHKVDLEILTVSEGQLLFILPNQIRNHRPKNNDLKYFKMSFDQECLSLLPKQFSFLINPLNESIITFDDEAKERVRMLFKSLNQILQSDSSQKDAETILAYLNALLAEFNSAYFKNGADDKQPGSRLSKYIEFKAFIENHLNEQFSIDTIAKKLSVSTNSLYNVVKEFSGVSPKQYITSRLMLEAQRILHYSNPSAKELAYELGFNDPDYFSRLFKKSTGKNISNYLEDIQDL
jgi:AraC-like DNA-binding protein